MIEIQRPKGAYGAFTGVAFPQEIIGIYGQDEGINAGTGTILNVTGDNISLSLSGTVLNISHTNPSISFPQELIGIMGWDDGVPRGTGTIVDFGNNLTASLSGTVLKIDSATGGEAFPVGSVFIAVVSTDPATLLGYGTWSAFGAGRVLIGLDSGDTDFDTAEETGGAKTVASSAQTFAGSALGTHQHAAISAGTPSGTVAAPSNHASHTHDYTQVPNHVHVENAPSSASGGAVLFALDTNASGSTAAGISTANPTGGVPTGTTTNPSATLTHNAPEFTGSPLETHQHASIGAGTPAGTNTPGAATSVVQPYIVVYMWKRTA